jgi:hypothetical protein
MTNRFKVQTNKIIHICVAAINGFAISSLLLCSACVTASGNILPDASLRKDEGILITKIRTNIIGSRIYIHGKDETWPLAMLAPVQAPEDLRVIKIKSGTSYFSKMIRGETFVWGPLNYFNIEAGTITYVGDLVVEWSAEKEGVVARIIAIDREEETMAEVKKLYPWLFLKFPYRKCIANADQIK